MGCSNFNKGYFYPINSHEHLDIVIWNEILRKISDIEISPFGENSKDAIEFNQDLSDFKRKVRSEWADFFNDKKRFIKKNTWKNEETILRIIEDSFNQKFKKWESKISGTGRLFLWKVMAPEIDKGSYTYFNGMLTEGFRSTSSTFVKFGLRWLESENNIDKISSHEADLIYKELANTYNNYYKMFHGREIDMNIESMSFIESSKAAMDNITGAESLPLKDIFGETMSEGLKKEINPFLGSVFGYNTKETVGYIMTHNPLDPSILKEMKLASHYNFIPQAYLPMDYNGGNMPHITGYKSYNQAMENKARLFLGNSVNKGTLFYKDLPVSRMPFEEVGGVTAYEKKSDLHSTLESKKITCE